MKSHSALHSELVLRSADQLALPSQAREASAVFDYMNQTNIDSVHGYRFFLDLFQVSHWLFAKENNSTKSML